LDVVRVEDERHPGAVRIRAWRALARGVDEHDRAVAQLELERLARTKAPAPGDPERLDVERPSGVQIRDADLDDADPKRHRRRSIGPTRLPALKRPGLELLAGDAPHALARSGGECEDVGVERLLERDRHVARGC